MSSEWRAILFKNPMPTTFEGCLRSLTEIRQSETTGNEASMLWGGDKKQRKELMGARPCRTLTTVILSESLVEYDHLSHFMEKRSFTDVTFWGDQRYDDKLNVIPT